MSEWIVVRARLSSSWRKATWRLCGGVAVALFWNGLAAAHHSFPAHYLEQQMVTVTGALVAFEYRAPHAWVKIKVRDERGEDAIVAAEWSNPGRLARDGVTETTLRAGDVLTIAGSPGRDPAERRMHLKAIQRPADGWEWPEQRRRRPARR